MDFEYIITKLGTLGMIALAMLLGAVIGYERELASKPAGMRTHMLVAGSAALLISLSDTLVGKFEVQAAENMIRSDPIRIIEAIITGVSFLGAGTIIRNGRHGAVEGLTTAASLLFTAGVGVCVALRELILATGATVLVLITLRFVHVIERRLAPKKEHQQK